MNKRRWEVKISSKRWHDVTTLTSGEGFFVSTRQASEMETPVKVKIVLPDDSTAGLVGDIIERITPTNPDGYAPGVRLALSEAHQGDLILLTSMASAYDETGEAPAGDDPCLEVSWSCVEDCSVWLNGVRPPTNRQEQMVELVDEDEFDEYDDMDHTSTDWPPPRSPVKT